MLYLSENLINYQPKKCLSVVFLPYKASMWDCFDSIYRAIKQEEVHQVTVMPIPFDCLDANNSPIKRCYEGDLLPSDIAITNYRTNALAKLRPDVIFIHNPYDQYNYVTRIPEEYFSKKLIKITRYLVYIPYFVRSDSWISDNMVLLPGVINAWRVYVQSDEIKRCYQAYFTAGNKIVSVGSPKIDMLLRENEREKSLPLAWQKKFQGKKIFLYNRLLNDAEGALVRFDLINNKEDVFCYKRTGNLTKKYMYGAIIPYEDYVYILPAYAEQIIIFAQGQATFSYISIKKEHLNKFQNKAMDLPHFGGGIPRLGGVSLFPITHRGILELVYQNGEWCSKLKMLNNNQEEVNRWLYDFDAQLFRSSTYLLPVFIDRIIHAKIVNKDINKTIFSRYLKSVDERCGERI